MNMKYHTTKEGVVGESEKIDVEFLFLSRIGCHAERDKMEYAKMFIHSLLGITNLTSHRESRIKPNYPSKRYFVEICNNNAY